MGNTKIRNYQRQNKKWIDKNCNKHKHIYDVSVAIELTGDKGKHIGVTYYTAFKCRYCNSFTDAVFSEDTLDLPILRFRKPHFALGFKDIEFISFN